MLSQYDTATVVRWNRPGSTGIEIKPSFWYRLNITFYAKTDDRVVTGTWIFSLEHVSASIDSISGLKDESFVTQLLAIMYIIKLPNYLRVSTTIPDLHLKPVHFMPQVHDKKESGLF